jgi:hypothetical protein
MTDLKFFSYLHLFCKKMLIYNRFSKYTIMCRSEAFSLQIQKKTFIILYVYYQQTKITI